MSRYIIELPNKVKIDVDKHKGEMIMGVLVGEVVMCKECHFYVSENHECAYIERWVDDDCFCNYGERESE